MINVIFLGTPAFSVPTLQALLADPVFQVLGVLTQPDRPVGRGQKLAPTPVKAAAMAVGLPIHQPEKLRQDAATLAWLKAQAPDFLVTVAYGQILSQDVLDIPKYGTVNVHASLLPELRGPNPIQWAILQGKTQTGLTTMLTERGVDTGPMLLNHRVDIDPNESAEQLSQRLSEAGGPLLVETLKQLKAGTLQPQPQDETQATHAPKLTKDDALLDWSQPAEALHHKIRGQQPWPGAVTFLGDLRLKILESRVAEDTFSDNKAPGTILNTSSEDIQVQTGHGILQLLRVQPPGKAAMAAADWGRGLQERIRGQFT